METLHNRSGKSIPEMPAKKKAGANSPGPNEKVW
jgi:hypothetical protein